MPGHAGERAASLIVDSQLRELARVNAWVHDWAERQNLPAKVVHKIDLCDGVPDGCPPLGSRASRERWLQVMATEYQRFREAVIRAERFGEEAPWLDEYGASAIDEFFAVACEAYFVNRARFTQEFAALTELFDGFYRER